MRGRELYGLGMNWGSGCCFLVFAEGAGRGDSLSEEQKELLSGKAADRHNNSF